MKINITAKNFELTPIIKEYIEKKMNHLEKFMKEWVKEESAELDFDTGKNTKHHNKGDIYYAEANLKVPGKMIRAQEKSDNLYSAIDSVKEILAEEIKKYKNKKRQIAA